MALDSTVWPTVFPDISKPGHFYTQPPRKTFSDPISYKGSTSTLAFKEVPIALEVLTEEADTIFLVESDGIKATKGYLVSNAAFIVGAPKIWATSELIYSTTKSSQKDDEPDQSRSSDTIAESPVFADECLLGKALSDWNIRKFAYSDQTSIGLLLKAIHYQTEDFPQAVTLEQLYSIAKLCRDHDCKRVFSPWIRPWIREGKFEHSQPTDMINHRWILVGDIFHDLQKLKNKSIQQLITQSTSMSCCGNYFVRDLEREEETSTEIEVKAIPENHREYIFGQREKLITQIVVELREFFGQILSEDKRTFDLCLNRLCFSFSLGSFLKSAVEQSLWPLIASKYPSTWHSSASKLVYAISNLNVEIKQAGAILDRKIIHAFSEFSTLSNFATAWPDAFKVSRSDAQPMSIYAPVLQQKAEFRERDAATKMMNHFQSIGFISTFHGYSPEELRLMFYTNKSVVPPVIGQKAPPNWDHIKKPSPGFQMISHLSDDNCAIATKYEELVQRTSSAIAEIETKEPN